MSVFAGPNSVESGLVLYLDAANTRSYPGTGTTWFDLSGNGRNYTFGTGITWNAGGYFACNGTGVFTGPASNSFRFSSTNEHTIISFAKIANVTQGTNSYFYWEASPTGGGDTRAIQTHFPWSDGVLYYDVSGCCGSNQRISSSTADDVLYSSIGMATWRTRTSQTPNRQFFVNGVSRADSGANGSNTVTWDRTTSAQIASGWQGNIHTFMVYNRALTDDEITQTFQAFRGRYGV